MSAADLYREAQLLVRAGQPVFPCVSSGKKAKAPLTANGFKDATLDVPTIKAWLREYRTASLAIPTGVKYDVLDIDTKNGVDGRVHLTRLRDLGLLNGCKKVIATPSGGYHLYFRASKGLTNKAHKTLGLDVRARGGYVLIPPSRISTPEYTGDYVDHGQPKGSTDDPLFWDLIRSCLTPMNVETSKPLDVLPSERHASIASLREWVSNLTTGERNNGLHWAVCRCVENGIDPHELVEAATLTGLETSEILLTVRSAMRRAGVSADDLHTEAEALFPDDL